MLTFGNRWFVHLSTKQSLEKRSDQVHLCSSKISAESQQSKNSKIAAADFSLFGNNFAVGPLFLRRFQCFLSVLHFTPFCVYVHQYRITMALCTLD